MLAVLPPVVPRIIRDSAAWVAERRIAVASACTALLIAVAIAAFASHIGRDAPLFDAPLAPAQGAEVEQALTLWNEPYTANAQGAQIMVPASRKRDILLRLALAGLPRRYAPTSTDLLAAGDNPLTPESVIDDRRRSGIEGDLVASLRRIAGVADATVVIAPSSGGPFDDESLRSPPSASVQLILEPGAHLTAASIAGVQRFVAAAYPGLAAQRVTVVDGNGGVLGAGAGADHAATREAKIQSAVQTALDAVLGAGAAVVRVSTRTAGVSESEQSTRLVPRGMLDAENGNEHGTESGRAFDKQRTLRHYAFDTIVEKRSTPIDAIRKISVAVFLDAHRVDAARARQIAALVRAAAGADLSAGDEVVVDTLAFAPPPQMMPPAGGARPPLRAIVPAVAFCVLVALGISMWPRLAELRRATEQRGEALQVAEHLQLERPHTAAHVLRTLPPDLRVRVLRSWDAPRRNAVQEALDELYHA